jgi:DNA-binding winged helix-turn-helix (wHTH) protein/tetratricopeptide (TPR) repeat protein
MADSTSGVGTFTFGDFRLDPGRRCLTFKGQLVPLRPTVFDVLCYLVQNPGRVVGKEELLNAVWSDRTVEEANLSQAVFWLRLALEQHGGEYAAGLIITARGRGYRFTAEPTWIPRGPTTEASPITETQPPLAASAAPPDDVKPARRGRWAPWAVGALLALLVVVAIGAGLVMLPRASHPLRDGNMIVLADFQNDTHDPIFDRTLADVLRIDLGQSPYVVVLPDKRAREILALMKQPDGAPLTAALSQEVCLRANANAVLAGSVASFGSRYLLTLIATDCSGQHTLAAEKADVASRDGVVPALDDLIAKVRGKLGEPLASVDRFDVPLAPERTGSLDALKAYSEGVWMVNHGRRAEAIQLERHAIELDPDFVMAYSVLGAAYYNMFDFADAKTVLTKAYQLREKINERSQMRISVIYSLGVTKDFDVERRDLAEGLALYPKDDVNWANFANIETFSGNFEKGVEYAQRSLALNPHLELPYSILARAQLGAGRPREALETCRLAVQRGLAGEAVHREMLRIAWDMSDLKTYDQERRWAEQNPPAFSMMWVEGEAAWSLGKLKEGAAIFDRADKLSKGQGLGANNHAYQARILVDMGLPAEARRRLADVPDKTDWDYLFTIAEIGPPDVAVQKLAASLRQSPSDTLLNFVGAPEVHAALALRKGNPTEAIADLQPALPYRARSPEVDYLLGLAHLAAKDGRGAAEAFNTVLTHKGWYPETPLYSLASLGLARALVLQHDLPGARQAYQRFLTLWKDADPDLPTLKAAKSEYAHLS